MNARISIALAAAILAAVSGCTTSTGQKVKISRSELASVKRLGVLVTAEKPFQVRFARDEAGSTGAMVGAMTFGLSGVVVGSTIEAGAKAASDHNRAKALGLSLGDFNGPAYLQQQVTQRLSAARMFEAVTMLTTNQPIDLKGADARLALNVREWGLRRQQAGGTNELLQVALDVNVRLVRPNGTAMWERDDVYLDGVGTSLEQFRDTPGLLVERLSSALNRYSGRVVNELRYTE